MRYNKHYNTRSTPQTEKIPGSTQVANSAGGFSWQVDDWTRLDRFLVLGTEGGTYYAGERKLTIDNADCVKRCIDNNGKRTVERIIEVSVNNEAVKTDPAIFALAMAAKMGDDVTRKLALQAVDKVCRIGTHLFHFAEYIESFGGWSRGSREAVARWYNNRPADELAYQLVKYKKRGGWSHQDLLRLAHVKPVDDAHNALYCYVIKGSTDGVGAFVEACEELKECKRVNKVVRLITEHNLPREVIPTEWLNRSEVWEAMLPGMPMTALIRNLGNLSKAGVLAPMSDAVNLVVDKITNKEALKKARVHPLALLVAQNIYGQGHGHRGRGSWEVVPQVVDALDDAFYMAFKQIEPSGKRMLLALDVSGSMEWSNIAGMPGVTPMVGSAAMAMATARSEKNYHIMGFSHELVKVPITARQKLKTAIATMQTVLPGETDCALPMIWAKQNKIPVDQFVVYTDSETWAGYIHPTQALNEYRQKMGIAAKLVVVGMVANKFTIADPNDAGMMDVVGFSTSAPTVISNFAKSPVDPRKV